MWCIQMSLITYNTGPVWGKEGTHTHPHAHKQAREKNSPATAAGAKRTTIAKAGDIVMNMAQLSEN
jgi:hypothetical protein